VIDDDVDMVKLMQLADSMFPPMKQMQTRSQTRQRLQKIIHAGSKKPAEECRKLEVHNLATLAVLLEQQLLNRLEIRNGRIQGRIIVAGDFNLDPSRQNFSDLYQLGYTPTLCEGGEKTMVSGSHTYDNIWISQPLTCGDCQHGTIQQIGGGVARFEVQTKAAISGILVKNTEKLNAKIKKEAITAAFSDHWPVWAQFEHAPNHICDSGLILDGSSSMVHAVSMQKVKVMLPNGDQLSLGRPYLFRAGGAQM